MQEGAFNFKELNSQGLKAEDTLLEMLKCNALTSIHKCLILFNQDDKHKPTQWEKFNQKYQIDIVKMTRDHTYYMCGLYFLTGVRHLPFSTDKVIREHLTTLFRIWAQNLIVTQCNELIEGGSATGEIINQVRENFYEDVATIRPQFLNIIESAQISDNYASSAIAPSDGSLYESML